MSSLAMPRDIPTLSAVVCLSPESRTVRSPLLWSLATADAASARTSSSISSTPATVPSIATKTGVRPGLEADATAATSGGTATPAPTPPVTNASVPTLTVLPRTAPTAPAPGSCLKLPSSTSGTAPGAAATTASASGCLEFFSTAAADAMTSASFRPSRTATFLTTGLPTVSVPVLSNTTVSSSCVRSSTSPPRIKRPCLAPRDVPTRTAVGVARPSAHGHATTSTDAAI
mmetsp:Transcript_4438/g.19893  ORF Transcript_4438/g.19893 Transcript_4438/m.19893 type:complete len:230 (+) Transcript_4438:1272-1961(+)